MRVPCETSAETRENDDGVEVDGISATCTRCDHETFSFGTSDASVRRCLVLMREECPKNETNFYTDAED